MKKLILSIILAGYALINAQAASCKEEKNWYVQGTGSFGWHNKSKLTLTELSGKERQKNGFGGALAVGRIMDCWRIELEGSHRINHAKHKYGFRSNTSLMANAYCDIPVTDVISIYLGAGAGISSVNGKIPSELIITQKGKKLFLDELKKKSGHLDTVFAWQLMAGITFALSDNWDLVGGYRLFATTKPTLAKTHHSKDKIKINKTPLSNNVEIGLRFKF